MLATLLVYMCLSGPTREGCESVEAWPMQQWVGPTARRDCRVAVEASTADIKKNAPDKPVWVECEYS